MHKLMQQLAEAYAPENVKAQLAQVAELKREERRVRSTVDHLKRAIAETASHAVMHAALESATR